MNGEKERYIKLKYRKCFNSICIGLICFNRDALYSLMEFLTGFEFA